jgi:hypothetical protein
MMFFFAAAARAADEGGASAAVFTERFKWINFAIVLAALIWLFGKVLPPKFRANAENISSTITKAQAAKEEADRKLRDAQQRLARLKKRFAWFARKRKRMPPPKLNGFAHWPDLTRRKTPFPQKLKARLRNAPHALNSRPSRQSWPLTVPKLCSQND